MVRSADRSGSRTPRASRASYVRVRLQPDASAANFTRQVRSVSTSEVVSTSAPQTTCRLLIQTARWLRTVSAPSVTCTATSDEEQRGGTRQLAAPPVVIPHVAGCRDDRERDDDGADAMREMDRDLRIPVIGHEAAEHQREVGNRQPGVRVPHGRAHENLRRRSDTVVAVASARDVSQDVSPCTIPPYPAIHAAR